MKIMHFCTLNSFLFQAHALPPLAGYISCVQWGTAQFMCPSHSKWMFFRWTGAEELVYQSWTNWGNLKDMMHHHRKVTLAALHCILFCCFSVAGTHASNMVSISVGKCYCFDTKTCNTRNVIKTLLKQSVIVSYVSTANHRHCAYNNKWN